MGPWPGERKVSRKRDPIAFSIFNFVSLSIEAFSEDYFGVLDETTAILIPNDIL